MMYRVHKASAIVKQFCYQYRKGLLTDDGMLEIMNASFIVEEDTLFGELNIDYAQREIDWYYSQSLNVNDIKGQIPKIWLDHSDENGFINSNYGWCIFSKENNEQYIKAINALIKNKNSRHGTMVYIRPTIHEDAFKNGMSDFLCTFTTQIFIRNNKLDYHVYMRSNDAVFGYKNDLYWHRHVYELAYDRLLKHYPDLKKGDIYWNAASLHVYPRHFKLVENKLNQLCKK